jgi:DNA-directed RNA polymerase I, II, and III subunit RPABC1
MINKVIVKKTQIEMLQDRGYTIPQEEQKWLLNTKKKITFNQIYTKENNTLYVHYIVTDILDELKEFIKQLEGVDEGLIIGIHPDELEKKKYKNLFDDITFKPIQAFDYDDLCYNVTHHIGYDKHELIDKNLIIPTLVDIDQLPVLLKSDPVCRYFNWQVGDIIKIKRVYHGLNLIVQEDIGYRVVKMYF